MNKPNKGKRSPSAAAREIAAAVRELKLADQTINKVRRHVSPLAAEREITAAVIDLGAVTQVRQCGIWARLSRSADQRSVAQN